MKKVIKIFLIIFVIFILLIIAGGITLKILFPPEKIRELVLPKVEEALQRNISVGDISLKLWPPVNIHMKGVAIANAKGFDEKPMIKIGLLGIRADLLSLINKKVSISSIIIENPEILIEKNSKGVFNFEGIGKPKKEEVSKAEGEKVEESEKEKIEKEPPKEVSKQSILSFSLSSFKINNGKFEFIDNQSNIKSSIGSINQELSLNGDIKNLYSKGKIEIKDINLITPTNSIKIASLNQELNLNGDMETLYTKGKIEIKDINLTSSPSNNIKLGIFSINHDLSVCLKDKKIFLNEFTLSPQGFPLTLVGSVANYDTIPNIDITLKTTTLDIKKLIESIPKELREEKTKDISASGEILLGLKILGQFDPKNTKIKPKVDGRLGLKNINIKYTNLPKSISNVNGEIKFNENELNIENLFANLGDAGFNLSCLIKNFDNPYVKASFNGNFDLDEVKDYVPLEKGTSLAGKILANFKAEGNVKDINTFNMDGKVEFKNTTLTNKGLAKPISNLNGSIEISKTLINMPQISCNIGKSSLSLNGSIKNFLSFAPKDTIPEGGKLTQGKPIINFALKSPLLDLDEMLPQVTEEEKKKEEVKKKKEEVKPIPDISLDGKVQVDKLKFKKLEFTNLDGKLTLKERKLTLDGLVNIYSGKSQLNLWADLNDMSKIEYKLTTNSEKLQANDFLNAFLSFDRLFSKLDLKGEFSGIAGEPELTKKTLKGGGSFKSTDGKFLSWPLLSQVLSFVNLTDSKEISFKTLSTNFKIENEKIFLDDFLMNSPRGDVKLSGNYSFDGFMDYKVNIKLTKEESNNLKGKASLITGFFTDKDGRINLNLLIKGKAPKPTISLDTESAKDKLKEKLTEEAEKVKEQAVKEAEKVKEQAVKEAEKIKKEATDKIKKEEEKAKKKAKEKTKKAIDDAKEKAEEKLKDLF